MVNFETSITKANKNGFKWLSNCYKYLEFGSFKDFSSRASLLGNEAYKRYETVKQVRRKIEGRVPQAMYYTDTAWGSSL